MDLIDFSWLYLNEELSDFKLVIRPIDRHPRIVGPAAADAEGGARGPGGVQTRSRKRASHLGTQQQTAQASAAEAAVAEDASAVPAAAASSGRRTRKRPGAAEPQAAAAADQQHPPAQQQQQRGGAAVGGAPQAPPQQQQQRVAAGPGRRTRRAVAAAHEEQPPPPAAAAAAGDVPPDGTGPAATEGPGPGGSTGGQPGRRLRGGRQPHQQQPEQQQQQPDQEQQQQQQPPDAAGEEGPRAPPLPRVTRARCRAGGQQQAGGKAPRQRRAGGAAVAELPTTPPQPPQQQQQQQSVPVGVLPPATAGAAPSSSRAGQPQQQQQKAAPGTEAGPSAAAATAAGEGPDPLSNLPPGAVVLPVHAAVLSGTSEYFKLLIRGWATGLRQVLTLEVEAGEVEAAQHMVRFMYTGRLPEGVPPDQLLVMIRLADKYQVGRFLSAANTAFDRLPLDGLDLGAALGVWELPGLMLDSPGLAGVLAKATDKLLEVFGDLEKVWCQEGSRQDWLRLPARAVATLLGHEATAVHHENTALVALGAWLEAAPGAAGLAAGQRADLLNLVRLPYLTSSYLRDVLPGLPWASDLLEPPALLNAFQYAVASEATRQRLAGLAPEPGPAAGARPGAGGAGLTPHFRAPRPSSALNKLSFEWVIELSAIKRMAADARLWGRVVEAQSPLYYWAGFYWQLLFNVERTTPPDASPDHGGPLAPGSGGVLEFVGVRCHASVGRHDFWPRLVRFKANIAALQAGFWEMDYLYSKALEGHIVDGVGLGYPGFFALGGGAGGLDADGAWTRFARNNRISLRCEVYECE